MTLPREETHTVETFEAYVAKQPDAYCELIDGVIVEKTMPTEEHGIIVGILLGELYIYARANGLGMPGPEIRFRVPGNEGNVRQPDIAMTLDPNLPVTERGATPRVPDVIVEVKSPDDSNDALRDKARFYVANGARLVWLVFPRPQIVEVYRPDVSSEILTVNDTLTGFEVLPGFALSVATLFSGRGEG